MRCFLFANRFESTGSIWSVKFAGIVGRNHQGALDKRTNSRLFPTSIYRINLKDEDRVVDLLIQLCGLPLFICLVALGIVLTGMALYLAISVKQISMLVAFFPLALLPIMVGLVPTLFGTLSAIRIHLNPDIQVASEPGFMLLVNAIPLLAGLVVAIPPALIVVVGRWTLAWKASGLQLMLKREAEPTDAEKEENWKKQEANDYLRDLVRPR